MSYSEMHGADKVKNGMEIGMMGALITNNVDDTKYLMC
jgi:hypothetical protein